MTQLQILLKMRFMGAPELHGGPEPEGDEPWRNLFAGRSSREILLRLTQGDQLELWPRCAERVLQAYYLVDMERLYLRSVARIAYAGPTYSGTPEFNEFVRERIDYSMEELMREDREEERAGIPVVPNGDPRFAFVSGVLGMELGVTRRGVCQFNLLDRRIRRAFFGLVVQAKRLNRYLAEGNGPPERVIDDLRIAFEVLGAPYDDWMNGREKP